MIKIAAMVGAPDLEMDTLAIYSQDLEAAFRKLAALGYQGVEIMTRDPWSLDGEVLRELLGEHKLEPVGLCTGHVFGEDGLGLVGPDPEKCRRAMDRVKGFLSFAGEYFEPGAFVNLGRVRGPGYPGEPERTLAAMAEAFRTVAAHAAGEGVRVVLEPINNHQTNFIHTTQDGLEMVRRVGHPAFGLMLDVYHMNIEDDDMVASFREAGDRCWFVHFADNNRKGPGQGHLPFETLVGALHEIGYEGYVSLEILPWPDPDTAARSTIQYLRQFIPAPQGNGTEG